MEIISTGAVIVGITQGLFIGSALLLDKNYASVENRYIGITMILFSIQGILDSLEFWNLHNQYLWIEVITYFGLQGAIFPPYLLSVSKSLKTKFPLPIWTLFVPFLLSIVHGVLCTAVTLLGKKESLWHDLYLDEFWLFHWYLNILFVFVLDIYLLRLIIKSPPEINKRGPLAIWSSFSVIIFLWITFNVLGNFFWSQTYYLFTYTFFWISVTIFLFWLTYQGVVQQRLVNEQKSLHLILSTKRSEEKFIPENEETNNYYDRFISLLERQKMYRDPHLSRDKVAKKLGISSGYFSAMLSKSSTQSFNEIVNEYRVKEVTKILSDGSLSHFSLVAIGLEVGFKSKSTFFSNFKKLTGSTPNDYKEKMSVLDSHNSDFLKPIENKKALPDH